jgi:hypothetical protein
MKSAEEIAALANALDNKLKAAEAKSDELRSTIAECKELSVSLQNALQPQSPHLPLEVTPFVPDSRDTRRLAAEANISDDSVKRTYWGAPVKKSTANAVLQAAKVLGIPEPTILNVRGAIHKDSLPWLSAKN